MPLFATSADRELPRPRAREGGWEPEQGITTRTSILSFQRTARKLNRSKNKFFSRRRQN